MKEQYCAFRNELEVLVEERSVKKMNVYVWNRYNRAI